MATSPAQSELRDFLLNANSARMPKRTLAKLLDEFVLPHYNPPNSIQSATATAFQQALNNSIQSKKAIDNIDLPCLERKLLNKLHRTQEVAREDPRDSCCEQVGLMDEMVEMMVSTIAKLHRVFFDLAAAEHMTKVHETLQMMSAYNRQMVNACTDQDYEDHGAICKVKGNNGVVIYDDNRLNNVFLKVWRDLLLVAMSLGANNIVKIVLAYLGKRKSDLRQLNRLIRPDPKVLGVAEGSPDDMEVEGKEGADEGEYHSEGWDLQYNDDWHSPAMRGKGSICSVYIADVLQMLSRACVG